MQHAYLREWAEGVRAGRPDVVRGKLLEMRKTVTRLRSVLPVDVERLEQDDILRWGIKHGLHIAAEALVDAGNHIPAGEFHENPGEYREIAPRLAARGVLTAATVARLDSLAGFRNVLVYDYMRIDVPRLHAGLDRLDDLNAFVADVEHWLATSGR